MGMASLSEVEEEGDKEEDKDRRLQPSVVVLVAVEEHLKISLAEEVVVAR